MKLLLGRKRALILVCSLVVLTGLAFVQHDAGRQQLILASKANAQSLINPFLSFAKGLLPKPPHVVLLASFSGTSGGVEARIESLSTRTAAVVARGAGRRSPTEADSALKRIEFLDPDPAISLQRYLTTFLASTWPPVSGVVLFTADSGAANSSQDIISHALGESLPSRQSPWIVDLDFSESSHGNATEADLRTISTLEFATHLHPSLHLLHVQTPPATLLIGDAYSTRRSLIAALSHAALGHRPISLPFFTGSSSSKSLGVSSDDVAAIVTRAITVMRKGASAGTRGITRVAIREPEEELDQWDLASKIIGWTKSSSHVTRKPTTFDPRLPAPRTADQERLERLVGNVTFSPILDVTRDYITSLLSSQIDYSLLRNATSCSPKRLSPSSSERLRKIEATTGCTTQLLTLSEGRWWTVGCSPDSSTEDRFGSVVASRAIPDNNLHSLVVDVKRVGKKELQLRFMCPTRTQPSKVGADPSTFVPHGFWRAAGGGGSGWRDVNAWYPSASDSGGLMADTFVVDLAGATSHEGFGLRLSTNPDKQPSTWISINSTAGQHSTSSFGAVLLQDSAERRAERVHGTGQGSKMIL
ncbi:hypothetical protein RQP46_001692 [Phenoliferia psychrophenolica]